MMLTYLIAGVVSYYLFTFIFRTLNKSEFQFILRVKEIIDKLKRKNSTKFLPLIVLIVLFALTGYCFNLSDMMNGVILGLFFALTSAAYGDMVKAKK